MTSSFVLCVPGVTVWPSLPKIAKEEFKKATHFQRRLTSVIDLPTVLKPIHYTHNYIVTMSELNALGYPKLVCKTPVPSDIEVSQQIVKEVGLLPIVEVAKQYVTL